MKTISFVLSSLVFLFLSCTHNDSLSNTGMLALGVYEDSYKSFYKITEDEFLCYGEDYTSYEGYNLDFLSVSENSLYVYMQYRKSLCEVHSDFTNGVFVYDEDAKDVGRYYAVFIKRLSKGGCLISGAYKQGGKDSCETLEEAKKEFTVENGYFESFSECKRVD